MYRKLTLVFRENPTEKTIVERTFLRLHRILPSCSPLIACPQTAMIICSSQMTDFAGDIPDIHSKILNFLFGSYPVVK